ncbi:MAG: DegT/DnrJ/EryC1/StrS family aminotransferase [Candidatus Omnitrophica bacterium]|nr:DegT/DnrJ/EryC1/StrS family aminotransferase [Candidatus Omnitrophota bacterium]
MINVFQPSLGEEEIKAISNIFKTNWLGKGKKVEELEKRFAEYRKVKEGQIVSATCASEGLFTAIELLDLKPDDEVVIPTIGFVAMASAVCKVGAKPVFCDIDYRTLNSRVEDIDRVRTKKTRSLIINHYGGFPCEIDKISEYCKGNNMPFIEDAACAIDSEVNGKACGVWGDFGVWSFDSMKILVTADGGMVYVKDPEMADRIREMFYLGLPSGQKSGFNKSQGKKSKWWEYEITCYGRRAIMNDVTAAIGLVQLKRLGSFLKRRDKIAKAYTEGLKDIPGLLVKPDIPSNIRDTNYLYWIQLEKRDELANYLFENGIYTTFRYWPLHKVSKFGHDGKSLPEAERATQTTLNLPCHQSMTDSDIDHVISTVKKFMREKR